MKRIWKEIGIALFMGMILPGFLLNLAVKWKDRKLIGESYTGYTVPKETMESQKLTVRVLLPGETKEEMDIDTYLTGVVLGEMPASFEEEALKAQAVVARTYTLKAVRTGGKHGNGSICTDSGCCQAYISREEYLRTGTENAVKKVEDAVYATSGQVLTYQGELIEAVYFSCSGGSTEDAVAVWGTDYPYLRATESPGEEYAAYYTDSVHFSAAEFCNKLGQAIIGDPKGWIGYATYTAGGGVNTIRIGEREYKGTEVRALLGLRSTVFTMKAEEEGITVTTKGFGHRVGMSQYGAEAMAAGGSAYPEILAHYYSGTELTFYRN